MGLKVDMTEVNELKKSIESALNGLDKKIDTLKNSCETMIATDGFKGKTATSVKSYTKTFHFKNIELIKTINRDYKDDVAKTIEKFNNQVDSSNSAILVENDIKTYKEDIEKSIDKMDDEKEKIDKAVSSVSDITTAKQINSDQLNNAKQSFTKQIDNTIEKLNNFNSNNAIDGDLTENKITQLAGVISAVKNMPANRAKVSGTSAKVKAEYVKHATPEEIENLQKFLSGNSDLLYSGSKVNAKNIKKMEVAMREYMAVKAIGDGSFKNGYKMVKGKNINQVINNMDKRKLRKVSGILHSSIDDIKFKDAMKSVQFLAKNNPFEKGNFQKALKQSKNVNSGTVALLRKNLKDNNFKFTPKGGEFIFSGKSIQNLNAQEKERYLKRTAKYMGQSARQALYESMVPQSVRNYIKGDTKNIFKFINEELKGGIKQFKDTGILGKLKRLSGIGGKILKPLGAILAIQNNMKKKSTQEKIVGSGVDLAALGASAAAGAAVGSFVPIPFVGTILGMGAGVLVGAVFNAKYKDKKIIDHYKDNANEFVSNARKGFGNLSKGFKSVFA